MAAVLGDVRGNRGQLGDLMPSRIADGVPCLQTARAVATCLRHEIHDRIYALDGHQLTVMPGMSRLPASLASTLHATAACTLLAREAVG